MTITKNMIDTELTVSIEGRIDTTTAPQLDDDLKQSIEGVKLLILDFKSVNYISSAGLRVLLSLHKIMLVQGAMKLVNVNKDVMDIFEVTGFSDILTIE